jgi:hypothetical protein
MAEKGGERELTGRGGKRRFIEAQGGFLRGFKRRASKKSKWRKTPAAAKILFGSGGRRTDLRIFYNPFKTQPKGCYKKIRF